MTMETIFLIVLAAFNVWTIYFYNKLLLEVANDKEKEKKRLTRYCPWQALSKMSTKHGG